MTTSSNAPLYQPLTIVQGADYFVSVPFTDAATGDPIPLSSPKMQIRQSFWNLAPLILTPTLSASGNTVTVTVASADSLAVTVRDGFYDLFATRTDTGAEVKLIYGPVTFIPNVTSLP